VTIDDLMQQIKETERLIAVYRNADEIIVGTEDQIYSRLGRPIQPIRLSEMRECAAGGSRAANALQSKDVIHRADHVYRQRVANGILKENWYRIGGFRT
jgi:hypothetical protein